MILYQVFHVSNVQVGNPQSFFGKFGFRVSSAWSLGFRVEGLGVGLSLGCFRIRGYNPRWVIRPYKGPMNILTSSYCIGSNCPSWIIEGL